MIIGTKKDIELFLNVIGKDAPQVSVILSRLEWIVADSIWVIREAHDGHFEKHVEDRARSTGTVPRLTFSSPSSAEERTSRFVDAMSHRRNHLRQAFGFETATPAAPTVEAAIDKIAGNAIAPTVRRPTPRATPPIKKPPTGFKKVASYWNAVSGPRVDRTVRDRRLSMCTRYGGYTFAPVSGNVQEVTLTGLTIGGTPVPLPEDERPAVKVGDHVLLGQLVATGDVAKPCPYLIQKDSSDAGRKYNYYCNACGCGVKKRAELHDKTFFENVICPRIPPLWGKGHDSNDNAPQ